MNTTFLVVFKARLFAQGLSGEMKATTDASVPPDPAFPDTNETWDKKEDQPAQNIDRGMLLAYDAS